MGVLVKRSVRVKIVVTEEFRARRTAELRAAAAKLDAVRKRLEFELATVSKSVGGETLPVAERLRAGLHNNERARTALAKELETVEKLELGAEYERGLIEGLVEINVGDDFSKLASCEIVVKDDRVIEIREGPWTDPSATS